MRRLLLLAVLLCAPSVAHADDLFMLTPWYGCSATRCYTASGTLANNPLWGDATVYVLLECSPNCTPAPLGWQLSFFDATGQLTGTWRNSGDPRIAPPSGTTYGILTATSFPLLPDGSLDFAGSRTETVTLTTTPEPATFLLMGTGLVLILGLGRRFL